MAASNKRYQQPYSSTHVIHNTNDSIRADEPTYIRVFPRFLYSLHKRQTPFDLTLLAHIRPIRQRERDIGGPDKSSSRKSVSTSAASRSPRDGPRSPSIAQQQPQQQATQQTQLTQTALGFKTLAPRGGGKSPTPMSSMPSDFEHIFHYSETQ